MNVSKNPTLRITQVLQHVTFTEVCRSRIPTLQGNVKKIENNKRITSECLPKFVPTFKIVKVKLFLKVYRIHRLDNQGYERNYLSFIRIWMLVRNFLNFVFRPHEYWILKHKFNIRTQSGSRFWFTYNTFQTCSYLFLQA